MGKTFFKKDYLWVLIAGVALLCLWWVWTFSGLPVLFGVESSSRDILGILTYHRLFADIFLACFAAPVIEEFAFRFWCTGKRYAFAVSALTAAVLNGFANNWMAGLAVLLILIPSWLVVRKKPERTAVLIIVTSLLFGIGHYGTFSKFTFDGVMVMTNFIGFGLVACYVALNYGFIWAVALHSVTNGLLLIPALLFMGNASMSFPTQSFNVSLQPVLESSYIANSQQGDTLVLCGLLPGIASSLIVQDQLLDSAYDAARAQTLYKVNYDQAHVVYKMTVVPTGGAPHQYEEVVRSMIDRELIKADTTYEALWILSIAEGDNINTRSGGKSEEHIVQDLIISIRALWHIPLNADPGVNSSFPVSVDYQDFCNQEFDMPAECAVYLKENCGLVMKEEPGIRSQVIEFSVGDI